MTPTQTSADYRRVFVRFSKPQVATGSPGKSGKGLNRMNSWFSQSPLHDKRQIILHACFVTGIAFGLNYLWENIQCPWFFIHRGGNTGQSAMVFATLGDVAMTWMAQGLVAAVSRRWLWVLGSWHWQQWATILGAALGLSVLVESWALANSLWAYTAITPRVPGTPISALPVAQLFLLFPLTFGLSRKLIRLASDQSATAGIKRSPL